MRVKKWHRSGELIYTINEEGTNHVAALFQRHRGATLKEAQDMAELAHKAPQLMEACKKALTCASLPDSVRDVIKAAMAGTLEI